MYLRLSVVVLAASLSPAPQAATQSTQSPQPAAASAATPLELRWELGGHELAVVEPTVACTLVARNHTDAPLRAVLEPWLPPDARLHTLPEALQLAPSAEVRLDLRLALEPERLGELRLRVVGRDPETRAMLGAAAVRWHAAAGRRYVHWTFEPRTRAPFDAGERRQGGAACGRGHLRLPADTEAGVDLLGGAPPFAPRVFPHVTLFARAAAGARIWLDVDLVDGAARTIRLPLRTASPEPQAMDAASSAPPRVADARADALPWERVTCPLAAELERRLGRGTPDVRALRLGADAPIDVDELAIVRDADWTAGDRLRDLTERWRDDLADDDAARLEADLATIAATELGPQERVDRALLQHALQWRRLDRELPRRPPGEPATAERYAAMLHHVHHLDMDADQLLRFGREQLELHQQQLAALAPSVAADASWREVVSRLRERHPTAAELPEVARGAMQEALDFTVAHHLVTVPMAARRAEVVPITDGPLSRTYPFGGYGGTRPAGRDELGFDLGWVGRYMIAPPAKWMDEREAAERLRGNHHAWTRVVALHEIVPGHHLQTVVHLMRPLSPFRRQFYSTVFAEGWALYCEDMMHRAGHLAEPAQRFTQLHMRLWRAARVVIDASLHTGRMSVADAERFLVEEAALDAVNAHAEVLRYVDNPTRPMSYLLGWSLLVDLIADARAAAAAAGTPFDEAAFRDRLLAFGPVPLPAVRLGLGLPVGHGSQRRQAQETVR